jgi:uncharacterized protein YheU (UPF0270 family)
MAPRPESERPEFPDADARDTDTVSEEHRTAILRALLDDRELREQLRRSREAMQRGEPPIPFKELHRTVSANHGGAGI